MPGSASGLVPHQLSTKPGHELADLEDDLVDESDWACSLLFSSGGASSLSWSWRSTHHSALSVSSALVVLFLKSDLLADRDVARLSGGVVGWLVPALELRVVLPRSLLAQGMGALLVPTLELRTEGLAQERGTRHLSASAKHSPEEESHGDCGECGVHVGHACSVGACLAQGLAAVSPWLARKSGPVIHFPGWVAGESRALPERTL